MQGFELMTQGIAPYKAPSVKTCQLIFDNQHNKLGLPKYLGAISLCTSSSVIQVALVHSYLCT